MSELTVCLEKILNITRTTDWLPTGVRAHSATGRNMDVRFCSCIKISSTPNLLPFAMGKIIVYHHHHQNKRYRQLKRFKFVPFCFLMVYFCSSLFASCQSSVNMILWVVDNSWLYTNCVYNYVVIVRTTGMVEHH